MFRALNLRLRDETSAFTASISVTTGKLSTYICLCDSVTKGLFTPGNKVAENVNKLLPETVSHDKVSPMKNPPRGGNIILCKFLSPMQMSPTP